MPLTRMGSFCLLASRGVVVTLRLLRIQGDTCHMRVRGRVAGVRVRGGIMRVGGMGIVRVPTSRTVPPSPTAFQDPSDARCALDHFPNQKHASPLFFLEHPHNSYWSHIYSPTFSCLFRLGNSVLCIYKYAVLPISLRHSHEQVARMREKTFQRKFPPKSTKFGSSKYRH
ncbi:hypothetical protein B0H13DRAFT_2683575, partial [Mycena leptocephala]